MELTNIQTTSNYNQYRMNSIRSNIPDNVANNMPNGLVKVREAVWRATTNRATPIEVGETIRVAGIDGLWLEVEPEEGAAKDYRDRSKNK